MDVFNTKSRIIITCNKWLAQYLKQEVNALGFEVEHVFQTGIELLGSVNDCIKLNLNLRCASQIHYSLKTFECNHPDELYNVVFDYPWEELLAIDGYFSVSSHVDHPTINTPLFANVKVKDAIVDRLRRLTAKRPDTGPDLTGAVIHLYWKGTEAEIFIDTSGETLAKHGYRKIPGKAPMLEALASGTLLATKWDRKSPFVNPMCGSGTLAIEAALIATNRVPGLYRENYAFMHIIGYDENVYKNELLTIQEQIKEVPGLRIIATDIRQDAIDVSKVNAGMAGVEHYIHFNVCDFEQTEVPENEPGIVYLNPEYGERMGEITELENTYARIGDFMKKKCKGYTGYIFTGNLDLAKKIGLKANRRIEFFNAKLDCRLLEYDLYAGTRKKEKAGNTEA